MRIVVAFEWRLVVIERRVEMAAADVDLHRGRCTASLLFKCTSSNVDLMNAPF